MTGEEADALKLARSFMRCARDKAQGASKFSQGVSCGRWMSARDVLCTAGFSLKEIDQECGEKAPQAQPAAAAEEVGGS